MNDYEETFWLALVALVLALTSGCASPTCADNPRNMQCMTPAQLEKELNQ